MADGKRVVLLPVADRVEPECERAPIELAKSGWDVRRMAGNSAIDLARSLMATEVLDQASRTSCGSTRTSGSPRTRSRSFADTRSRCSTWAPDSCSRGAAAEVLFHQARALITEGKLAEACPKLAESNRLDSGIGTMLYLADCYEKSEKTASAWATFREAANFAKKQGDAREKVAQDRAAALEPKLVTLQITVPVPSREPGLEILRDGTELGSALWGTALPIDPGEHVIEARAPGKKAWTTTVMIVRPPRQADAKIEIPVLEALPKTKPPRPAAPADANVGSTQRTVGIIAGGVGIVGVGIGTYFGLAARSKADDATPYCDGKVCMRQGLDDRTKARDLANLSTAAFVAGGTVLVAGAVIYFSAPNGKKQTAISKAAADGFRIRF